MTNSTLSDVEYKVENLYLWKEFYFSVMDIVPVMW